MPHQSMFLRCFSASSRFLRDDLLVLVDEGRDHHEAEHADRDVDVEDPRPGVVVDDVAAERRADGGAEHDGHGEERHRHALLLGRERLPQDRLLGRLERARAEALEDAVDDERVERARRAAQRSSRARKSARQSM